MKTFIKSNTDTTAHRKAINNTREVREDYLQFGVQTGTPIFYSFSSLN